jgi:hypothetical protein
MFQECDSTHEKSISLLEAAYERARYSSQIISVFQRINGIMLHFGYEITSLQSYRILARKS